MRSRFTTRLVGALLLLLAAFGLSGASVAGLGMSQAVVRAQHEVRRAPHRVSHHILPAAPAPQPVLSSHCPADPRPVAAGFHRWLFQRPPPYALLLQF
ncbi:MAG TPA: hypothetical protein VLY04_24990 [Bryobacteraceae bacterium]|nr:hypothetical protein [Bryobacteraceae bacterium]